MNFKRKQSEEFSLVFHLNTVLTSLIVIPFSDHIEIDVSSLQTAESVSVNCVVWPVSCTLAVESCSVFCG